MSKRTYNMRWRENDEKELQRAINNFNQKLYRIKKNRPELIEYLPERVNKTQIKKDIQSRADFKRHINKLKRFSRIGAEEPIKTKRGAKTTKWEVKEAKIAEGVRNRQRNRTKEFLENEPVRIKGKSTGIKRAEMGSIKENEARPTNKNIDNMSQKEFDKFVMSVEKQISDKYKADKIQVMKENYLKGLADYGVLGSEYGNEIEQIVRNISTDEFLNTVTNDEMGTFDFYKAPEDFQGLVKNIRDTWKAAEKREMSD